MASKMLSLLVNIKFLNEIRQEKGQPTLTARQVCSSDENYKNYKHELFIAKKFEAKNAMRKRNCLYM